MTQQKMLARGASQGGRSGEIEEERREGKLGNREIEGRKREGGGDTHSRRVEGRSGR